MEESQIWVKRMKKVVMEEAEQVVARMEEAESRRMEELAEVMGKVIEGLEKELEEMGDQVGFVVK